MNYDRTERIRRAAILVASLDQELAEQMLASLPSTEAARVLAEVERLDDIDPEEQADVLEEFRRVTKNARATAPMVEFSYSAAARPSDDLPASIGAGEVASGGSPFSLVEASTIAEMLVCEHPQTIAAALSRLDDDSGAEVFAALPEALQPEVLDRLTNLQFADEGAVMEIESQLLERVEQQRECRERAAAGAELARRIVSRTSPAQRAALLQRLSASGASVVAASSLTRMPRQAAQAPPISHQAVGLAAAMGRASHGHTAASHVASRHATLAKEHSPSPERPAAPNLLEDRSPELEALSDRALIGALRVADERTVQCALAASSERFVKRVVRLLPRRDAKRLRQLLRALGPTRIADLRFAQHEFLRMAAEGAAVGV